MRKGAGRLLAAVAALFVCASCSAVKEMGRGGTGRVSGAPVHAQGKGEALPAGGAVGVAATLLWSEPGPKRECDEPLLSAPNDPEAWAGGLDLEGRLWLVGRAETMALFGEPVSVLRREGDWLLVAAVNQKTSRRREGYPGWVPASHIVYSEVFLKDLEQRPGVLVASPRAYLYADASLSRPLMALSYATRLPLIGEGGGSVAVRLPDGSAGYLSRESVKKEGEISFSREGLIKDAGQFLGVPYIWAGTASFGFDCSGFCFRLYQLQGIQIPRDADEQAEAGAPVPLSELLPGDLVFFAGEGGRGEIHHVGVYAGGGTMIHAPNSRSAVRVDPIDAGPYAAGLCRARRYAP